jgi:hypothetical protein
MQLNHEDITIYIYYLLLNIYVTIALKGKSTIVRLAH